MKNLATLTLTNQAAQRCCGSLQTIDTDQALKVAPATRMAIAININRLIEQVASYQNAIQRSNVGMDRAEPGKTLSAEQRVSVTKTLLEIEELALAKRDYELVLLTEDELRLEENPHIKVDVLSGLVLILA